MTANVNGEQRKALVSGVYDRAAATFDQVGIEFFGLVGRELVRRADPRPGERVLDVGCGRGSSALPAARIVGPSGHVHALDLAPGMVAALNEAAAAEGLTNLAAQVGDAERPDVEPGWNLIQASLALFFLPDLDTALRNYRRLLDPSGRLAFSWFGPYDPAWVPIFEALDPDGARSTSSTGLEGPFSDVHAIAVALAHAGFHEEETTEQRIEIAFRDMAHFWEWSWSTGGRADLERLQERGVLEATQERVGVLLEQLIAERGTLTEVIHVRFTVAR